MLRIPIFSKRKLRNTSVVFTEGSDSSSYKSEAWYGFVEDVLLLAGVVLQCSLPTTASRLPRRLLCTECVVDEACPDVAEKDVPPLSTPDVLQHAEESSYIAPSL